MPALKVSAEDLRKAEKILEKPYPDGVDFTMEVVEAKKALRVSKLKKSCVETEITAIGIGELAFVGMPAELFIELGEQITAESPFATTVINDLSYTCIGYIATTEAYQQGGYEVVSNIYAPEAGNILLKETMDLLKSLYKTINNIKEESRTT
ncbi:MAG: hypothetical protein PHV82_02630 [Victivallaceae bacterium]|nr:hypothetical protein [Victivallaceae bacterium]